MGLVLIHPTAHQTDPRPHPIPTYQHPKQTPKKQQDAVIQAVRQQNAVFNHLRWGQGPARIVLEMAAPEGAAIELETAPFDMMPHAIHYFLTLIETGCVCMCACFCVCWRVWSWVRLAVGLECLLYNIHTSQRQPKQRYWDGCHIIRNAHHVIQLNCGGRKQNPQFKGIHPSIAFQEFSPEFHHVAYVWCLACFWLFL